MLGVHINMMLDFREHHTHITKNVRKQAKTLAKGKLCPSYKTTIVEHLLKSKYHATHLGVFNERQISTIDGILNKAKRQAIGFLPNFPIEGVQCTLKEAGLGLPPTRDRATQMGIEHLTNAMNKNSERGFTTHAHVHKIITNYNHWPSKALETNHLKLPTLRILRLANTISGFEFENLPSLHHDNDIATSIRSASHTIDQIRQENKSTLQGQPGTKEYDKLARHHCKPLL
jgi:hypothetical protein